MKLEKSKFDGWETPEKILKPIRAFFDGVIDLDPCSNEHSTVGARVNWTKADNGLYRQWSGKTYVNPPFDVDTLAHVACAAYDVANFDRGEVVFMAPAKVDQVWYQCALLEANAQCAIKGRVPFLKEGKPGQGSMFACVLFYYGHRAERFIKDLSVLGSCVALYRKAA